MANLIIKPQNVSGDKVIIQDQAGGAVLTTADSGAAFTNVNSFIAKTIKITPQSAVPAAASGNEGQLYYDSDTKTLKISNGSVYSDIAGTGKVLGGIQTNYELGGTWYGVNTFLSSGILNVLVNVTADILVVAGGASGSTGTHGGAGGGAGGMRVLTSQALTAGLYTIQVGSGGAAQRTYNQRGNQGEDSLIRQISGGSFSTFADGGGAPGTFSTSDNIRNAGVGGSGGGGAETYTDNGDTTDGGANAPGTSTGTNGNNAGYYGAGGGASPGGGSAEFAGAGGGGAGGAGQNGGGGSGNFTGGLGGLGLENDFRDGNASGTVIGVNRFAGGGAGNGDQHGRTSGGGVEYGGGSTSGGVGTLDQTRDGDPNSGGGGGGVGTYKVSGAGGSGIVVIRYII